MSDYTPTNDEIEARWMDGFGGDAGAGKADRLERYDQFQRWLAEHDAKVRAEEREKDTREPSEDPCPEWQCPDLSSEDRREGKTCPDHPCTCTREPSDAEVEAGCAAFYEGARGLTSWDRLGTTDPVLAGRYRDGIRAALLAAQEVRHGN